MTGSWRGWCNMKPEEAKEKFGKEVVNKDDNVEWRPNHNAIRGACLKWAKERESIVTDGEEHDASVYVDDVWEWLEDKLGEGFSEVFNSDERFPQHGFNRVEIKTLENILNSFYENNDDYQEEIDRCWYVIDANLSVGLDGRCELCGLIRMSPKSRVEEFFFQAGAGDEHIPDKGGGPDEEAYKHYMKRWVLEVDWISSEENEASPEAMANAWLDWMAENMFNVPRALAFGSGASYAEVLNTPRRNEIELWAKEIWQNDDEVKRIANGKWNNKDFGTAVESEDEEEEDDGLRWVNKQDETKKSGQMTLGDL